MIMDRYIANQELHKRWFQRPITWAFIFLLSLISIIYVVALSSLSSIENEYISYNHIQERKLHLLDEMIHLSRQRAVLLRDIIISQDPFEKDEIILNHRNLATRYLIARNELSKLPLDPQEKYLINSIIERTKMGYNLQLKIIEYSMNDEEMKARDILTNELGPNRKEVYGAMLKLRSLLVASSDKSAEKVASVINTSRKTVDLLYLATFILGIFVAWFSYNQFKRGLKKIIWQANHDDLTGLLSRQKFEDYISETVTNSNEGKYQAALIYMDIDRFNIINNTSGHAAGDELLRQVSGILISCFEDMQIIGRVGGDQFAILLNKTNEDEALKYTETILNKIRETRFLWRDRTYDITLSIGILFTNSLQGNLDDIWTGAYISCELAKESGGNQYSIYQPDSLQIVKRRRLLTWSTRIKSSMANEKLVLFSQPIKNANNGCVHNEILLRYENENGLILSAKNFIPSAERYNLITDIDFYVIRKTLEYMRDSKSKDIYAINLSGITLGKKTIDREIIKLIDHYDINPEQVCFEITETIAITNKSNAVKFMNILHGIGCHFSLDDFGSGLSSFGYLRTLPIDTVKIDGFFVRNLEVDPANFSVINAVNDIAHGFGLKTIAESVESQTQLDSLKKIGIDYFQGYYIQKPEQLLSHFAQSGSLTVEEATI